MNRFALYIDGKLIIEHVNVTDAYADEWDDTFRKIGWTQTATSFGRRVNIKVYRLNDARATMFYYHA